jgi:hypothetical protein
MNNIHKSSNNMENIQYMPMEVESKKSYAYFEILILIVIIVTASVLTIDMYNSNNKVVVDE